MPRLLYDAKLGRPLLGQIIAILTMLVAYSGCGSSADPMSEDVSHFLTGKEAMDRGDNEVALQEFNKSIELNPDAWALYYRAKIHTELKDEERALADCEAGLQLDPDHGELKWLKAELSKRPERRFKGQNAKAPEPAK